MYAEGMSATLRTAIDVAAGAATQAAAIYVRQSRKKADGSEASPAVQLEECQNKAGSMGVLPLPVYEDLGISGYDPKAERPGFDRMLRDARAGKFSHVLVYYMSRFSRQEPLEVLAVVRELWAYGVTITSVTEGTFRPDDFGSLISLLVRLEGNHKESSLKSQNVRKTKKKARELGGYMGGPPPYGFTASKVLRNGVAVQVLEPHPVEAPIVAELVAFILANRDGKPDKHGKHPASKLSAVAWMNANPKAKPHRAKEWNEASVHRILIDPRLAGFAADYVYYKAADEERRRKTREYQIVRDEHGKEVIGNKAIVSPADWYALQAWMDSRKSAGRTSPGESLLAGSKLLYCECGKTLTRFGPVGYPVNYKCPRKRTDMVGRTHEGGNSIAAHKVDEWLARRVMARVLNADIDDPETLVILAEATRRYGQRVEAPATAGERTELVRARAADTKALEDLYDREEAGDYNDPVGRKRFRERKDRITTRLEAANARLIELDNLDTPSLPIEIWAGEEPGQDPIGEGSWWHGATLDERRDFLRLFVDRVTVKKAAHRGGNFLGVEYNHDARLSLEWARPPMPDDE